MAYFILTAVYWVSSRYLSGNIDVYLWNRFGQQFCAPLGIMCCSNCSLLTKSSWGLWWGVNKLMESYPGIGGPCSLRWFVWSPIFAGWTPGLWSICPRVAGKWPSWWANVRIEQVCHFFAAPKERIPPGTWGGGDPLLQKQRFPSAEFPLLCKHLAFQEPLGDLRWE